MTTASFSDPAEDLCPMCIGKKGRHDLKPYEGKIIRVVCADDAHDPRNEFYDAYLGLVQLQSGRDNPVERLEWVLNYWLARGYKIKSFYMEGGRPLYVLQWRWI